MASSGDAVPNIPHTEHQAEPQTTTARHRFIRPVPQMGAVDETQLRAADLPLHLLMNDETAEEAREEAGLPKLAITAPPPLPLPAVHVRARVHAKLSEFSQSGVLPLQASVPSDAVALCAALLLDHW
eukprot:6188543-Pleurochrysis_carterae.AAC.3